MVNGEQRLARDLIKNVYPRLDFNIAPQSSICDADRWARFTVMRLKSISLPQVDFPFILHATAKGDLRPLQDVSDKNILFLGKKYTLCKVYYEQQ